MLARQRQQQQNQGDEENDLDEDSLVLIGEMDASWKEECASLARRLDEWRRRLRELGDVPPSPPPDPAAVADGNPAESSLARILAGCRALVHGMLAELDLMEQIEREAVAEETRWVREANRRGLLGRADEHAPRAGAIWRVL
jgi:hypothetical protein